MMTAITVMQIARNMGMGPGEVESLLAACGIQPGEELQEQMQVAAPLLREEEQALHQKRAEEKLKQLAQRYTFLIDTCSLLHPQFPELMSHLLPLLRETGKALIVPSGVVAELQSLGERKAELREQIQTLIGQLAALKGEGLVRVFGENGESFGDKQLLATAIRFLTSTELLVITQDNALSSDLMHLNLLGSIHGKRVAVGRINHYGYLSRFRATESRFTLRRPCGPWINALERETLWSAGYMGNGGGNGEE